MRFVAALFIAVLSVVLVAGEDPSAPAPRTKEYGWMSVKTWTGKHDSFVKRAKEGKVDLLFLGDSITEGWGNNAVWQKHYALRHAANFGIGGDVTQNVLWRITSGGEIEGLSPKAVVLMIGTNNFGLHGDTEAGVVKGITTLVTTLRTKLPGAKILLLGIFPSAGTALEKSVSPLDYNSGYRRLRTLDGQIGGGLDVNRSGPFGFSLNGNLVRAVDPGPIVVGSRLARTALATGASGSLRPGGGTMSFTGGMGLTAEIYDPQNGRDPFTNQPLPAFLEFSQFPRNLLGPGNPADVAGLTPYANATVDPRRFHNAGVGLTGQWQWRFLPKSAVFVEGSLGSHFYLWPWDNPNAPTFPIGVTGGFLGQLTAKLGLVASIGLSYPVVLCLDPEALSRGLAAAPTSACARNTGLLNGQPADGSAGQSDLDTITGLPISQYTWFAPELTRWQALAAAPVGQLEARYQFTPTFTGAIGVRRQVRLVPLYRYLSDNRIYASLVGVLWNRVQLNAQISEAIQPHGQLTDRGVGYNAYPFDAQVRRAVPLLANSDPGRWDNDLALNAGVDIFATRWLLFGVSNQFTWHATNARTGGPNDPPGIYNELPFNLSYVRNVTMLKAELRY